MKKFKRCLQENIDLIPAFFIPVVILLVTFAILKIYPFGDRSVVNLDLYHQYLPIMSEFQRKLHGGESVFYSFNAGLGTNFYSLSTYQNASPVTWIFLALFPEDRIVLCAVCMILFKIGLISAVMYYYLKAVSKTEKFGAKERLLKLSLAVMFSLSGYILGYYTNIMWLDAIILLPLCVLGIRKAVAGKGNLLFVISLFLLLFTNYYIGAMVFIFLVLYYICHMVGERKRLLSKTTLRMLALSGIAVMMAMVVILPTLMALSKTADYGDLGEGLKGFLYYSVPTHFAQLLPGSNITVVEGPPNLYPGLICLIVFVMYIFQADYDKRKKIAKIVLTAFVFVSTNLIPLDLLWNFGHEPNSFTGRYSFIFAFLMIEIAAEILERRSSVKRSQIIVSVICIAGILGMSAAGENFEALDKSFMFIITGCFIALYAFVFLFFRGGTGATGKMFFAAVIFLETVIVTFRGIGAGNIVTSNNFDIYRKEVAGLTDIVRERDPYCRMELTGSENDMPPFVYGYRGTSVFASSVPQSTYDTLRKYVKGGVSGLNSFKFTRPEAESDSLVNIGYYISIAGPLNDPGLTEIAKEGNCYLYENKYKAAAGYMLPEGEERLALADNADLLNVSEMKGNSLKGSIDVTKKGNMFISIPYDEGWEIKVDGKEEKDAGKVKGFFSFELEEGYHEIEMSFVPRGFTAGVVLSLVGVGLLVVFIVVIDSSVTCRRRSE